MDGPSGAAPAPAPSAPASAPAAPSAPASTPTQQGGPDPRGKPPRGHTWAPQTPAGKVPIPSQPVVAGPPAQARAQTAQERSTGVAQPPKPHGQQVAAKPGETPQARQARLEKFKQADGSEVEVDVAEFVERLMSTEKRKFKVNGQEREATFNEAFERLPLADGAHERFREAKTIEEQAKAQIERAKRELAPLGKPETALSVLEKILGPQALMHEMEKRLAAQYQREAMPEAERRALEAREAGEQQLSKREQEIAAREEAFKAQEQAQRTARYEAAVKTETERIQRDFPILLKEVGLPTTPRMLARLAQAASEARALKIPYTEKQLAAQVAQEYREEIGHFSENAEPEVLRSTLGKGADKLREAEVARVMAQPGRGKPMVAKPGALPKEIRTPEDQRRYNRQRDAEADRIWRAKQDR